MEPSAPLIRPRSPWIARWIAELHERDETGRPLQPIVGVTSTLDRTASVRAQELDDVASGHYRHLQAAAASGVAEIRWVSDEQRRNLDELAAARGADLHRAGESRARGIEALAADTSTQLAQVAAAQLRRIDEGAAAARARLEAIARESAAAFEDLTRRIHEKIETALGDESDALRAGLEQRVGRMQSDLAASAAARQAEIETVVDTQAELLEQLRSGVSTLMDASSHQVAELSRQVDDRRVQIEELAAERMEALDEVLAQVTDLELAAAQRVVDLEHRAAAVADSTAAQLAQLEQIAGARGLDFRQRIEAALAEGLQQVRATASEEQATVQQAAERAATAAADALQHQLDERVRAFEATLVSAYAGVDDVAAGWISQLETSGGALRQDLDGMREDLLAALQGRAGDEAEALERAAAAWIARIERAGKRRRGAVARKRAAPPVAAVVLALSAVTGGSIGTRARTAEQLAAASPTLVQEVGLPAASNPADAPTDPGTNATDASPQLAPISYRAADHELPVAEPPPSDDSSLLESVLPSVACETLDVIC